MKDLFFQIFFTIAFFVWLSLCFFVALFGLCFKKEKDKIDVEIVKEAETICRILVRKKKITKANYEFEATQVSQYYDENTFDGYMFIVNPIIWVLHNYTFYDNIVTFVVRRWIRVQRHKLLKAGSPPPFFNTLLAEICVKLAYGVGRALNL